MSIPFGNGPLGLTGGPVMHDMPRTGSFSAGTLLTKKLTQAAVNMITGPTNGSVAAILDDKDICNDLMTIFIGDRRSLVFSVLGQVFTLSYAHTVGGGNLHDTFAIMAVSPAPVKHKNIRPPTSSFFLIDRHYDSCTRLAVMPIEARVAQTIQRLRQQIRDYNISHASGLPGDGWGDKNNVGTAEGIGSYVKSIEDQLFQCFGPAAYALKKSFDFGVSNHAAVVVSIGAMPLPLAEAVSKYHTSITDHSPCQWQLNATLYRSLITDYEKNTTRHTFGLAKHPERFIDQLIKTAEQHVSKVAHDTSDKAVVMYEGREVSINGVLVVSAQVYAYLTSNEVTKRLVYRGRLVNNKSFYYKPLRRLAESDSNMLVRHVHDDGNSAATESTGDNGLVDLLDNALDPKTFPRTKGDVDGGMLALTERGRRMLANSELGDDRAESTRPSKNLKYRLGEYNVDVDCTFFLYDGEAVLFAPMSTESLPQNALPDAYGRSPSLVSRQNVLFRASFGDTNPEHELAKTWSARICDDRDRFGAPASSSTSTIFSTKSVTIHTPAVSSQRLVFGPEEAKTVMLDPALYDVTDLAHAINANARALSRLETKSSGGVKFMKDMLRRLFEKASREEAIFKLYFESIQHETLVSGSAPLSDMELTPFHTVGTLLDTDTGKHQLIFKKRRCYNEIPIIDKDVIADRATNFLNRTLHNSDQRKLNDTLRDMCATTIFTDGKVQSVYALRPRSTEGVDLLANMRIAADKLYAMFVTWTTAQTHGPQDINFLFTPQSRPDMEIGSNGKRSTSGRGEITEDTEDESAEREGRNRPGARFQAEGEVAKTWLIMKYVLSVIATRGRVKFVAAGVVDDKERNIFNLQQDHIEEMNEKDDLYAMFADDPLHPHNKHVMSARAFWIVTKSNWTLVQQAAALIMDFWYLSPTGMVAQIDAGITTGYAIDFVKEECLNSEQMIYTKRGAYEYILSPAGKDVDVKSDQSVDVLSSCDIATTRNTLGAGSVIANTVIPNPSAVPGAEDRGQSPIISVDFITRTRSGTLTDVLANARELNTKEKRVIEHHLRLPFSIATQRNVNRAR